MTSLRVLKGKLKWSLKFIFMSSVFGLNFRAPKLELISNYEILLKKELEGDFGVCVFSYIYCVTFYQLYWQLTEDARETLREFRQKNGITSEIHLQCLRKHGWTLDDFEVWTTFFINCSKS